MTQAEIDRVNACRDAFNSLTAADIAATTKAQMTIYTNAWFDWVITGDYGQGIQHPPRKPPI